MATTLNQLQSEITTLTAKSELLREQICAAQVVAGESAQCSGDLTALRQQRNRLLAQIHLGRADDSMLAVIDKQLEGAEAAARKADQARQGAEGAAQVLTEERGVIQAELSALQTRLPAMLYAEHCRHAAESIAPYRAALEQLGRCHAVMQGRMIAADRFANAREGRTFIASAPVTSFSSTLPGIPGCSDKCEVVVDMTGDIQREVEASLAQFGGSEAADTAQRSRIEQAANEADADMRRAISALG